MENGKNHSDADAKFLAGIFEMGGGMSILPNINRGVYTSVRPYLYFNDNEKQGIDDLQQRYGNSVFSRGHDRSWRWSATNNNALELASLIKPYAPFRQQQIEAFEALNETDSLDKKLCIAEAFSRYIEGSKQYPDIDSYTALVKDQEFLMGVFVSHGRDYNYNGDNYVRLSSQNGPLIGAIGEQYGANVSASVNNKVMRKTDANIPVSFHLTLRNGAREAFLSDIHTSQ